MRTPKVSEETTRKVIVPVVTAATTGTAAYVMSARSPEVVGIAVAGFMVWWITR